MVKKMDGKESDRKALFEKVPTTIVSTNHEVHEMSTSITALRVLLWMMFKLVHVLYIPLFISRMFKKSRICPPIQDEIVLLSATELADKIRKQEITSEAAVRAYISRIEEVNPILNAVIEDRFKQAIEDAKYADKLISFGTMSLDELEEKHPLLGVPLTVKGSLEVAKMKSTAGMVTRANITAKTDAVAVNLAREAGAIPLLTSNIPELCMNWETSNKLKGRTKNPYSTVRTPGGSSGGEASLIGAACSVIGLGSDIAGSLRLPAHFCGIWGHKPSPGVVSTVGHYPNCKKQEEWKRAFSVGPVARYAKDLKLLLQIIVEPEMKKCLMLDVPVNPKEIKIYFIEDMESLLTNKVSNDCLEGLRQVVDHFNNICYNTCEKVKVPLLQYAPETAALTLLDIDDIDNIFTGRGEGSYSEFFRYATGRSTSTLTTVMYGLLRRITGYLPRSMFEDSKKTLKELKRDLINLLGIEGVLIMPSFPMEACFHGDMVRKTFDASYLWIFNALGLPVTNCHVKFTNKGLPVGVQVIGAPTCDRLTLAVAIEIEKAFGGWKPPPVVER